MRQWHRKRLNKTLARPIAQVSNQPAAAERFDVWLQRLSYISQFGLFLITIATIYYTVLPLYQKALLDEAIAKQEIKLKEVNELLEKTYASVRAYTVNRYVFFVDRECTGLIDGLKKLLTGNLPDDEEFVRDSAFEIDISACLINSLNKYDDLLQELLPEDRLVLKEKIQTIALSEALSILKQKAIAEYKEVSSLSEDKINTLPSPEGMSKRLYDALHDFLSPEQRTQFIQERKIRSEKHRIEASYIKKVSEMIHTLKKLKWAKKTDRQNGVHN